MTVLVGSGRLGHLGLAGLAQMVTAELEQAVRGIDAPTPTARFNAAREKGVRTAIGALQALGPDPGSIRSAAGKQLDLGNSAGADHLPDFILLS